MCRLLLPLLLPFLLSGSNNNNKRCGVDAHSHHMSRHLVLEDLSMVVIMTEAEQTQGPFGEQDDDYVWTTNDLTAAGRAGAPGLDQDRLTVVNGAPLELDMTVYDVSNPLTVGGLEMAGVQVFLWHTDAAGVYSSVDDPQQPTEFQRAAHQVWCRGVQVTNATGQVTFKTILPGWYPGRALHYHVRLRFPGETVFAATTQLYISDSELDMLQTVEPYNWNGQSTTVLQQDGIFARLDPLVQDQLTLKLERSSDTGFRSSLRLGLVPNEISSFQGDGSGGASDPDGNGAAGENVILNVVAVNEPSPLPTVRQTANPTMILTGAPILSPPPTTSPTAAPIMSPPPTTSPTTTPIMSPPPTTSPTTTPIMSSPPTTNPTTAPIMSPPPTTTASFSAAPRPVPAPVIVGPEGTFFFEVGSNGTIANSTTNNNNDNSTKNTDVNMEVQKQGATEDETAKAAMSSASSSSSSRRHDGCLVLGRIMTLVWTVYMSLGSTWP